MRWDSIALETFWIANIGFIRVREIPMGPERKGQYGETSFQAERASRCGHRKSKSRRSRSGKNRNAKNVFVRSAPQKPANDDEEQSGNLKINWPSKEQNSRVIPNCIMSHTKRPRSPLVVLGKSSRNEDFNDR